MRIRSNGLVGGRMLDIRLRRADTHFLGLQRFVLHHVRLLYVRHWMHKIHDLIPFTTALKMGGVRHQSDRTGPYLK